MFHVSDTCHGEFLVIAATDAADARRRVDAWLEEQDTMGYGWSTRVPDIREVGVGSEVGGRSAGTITLI